MKRIASIIVLSIALAGCTQLQHAVDVITGASVTPQEAYIAANGFDAVEQSATNYLRLPPCASAATKLCRNQAAAVKIASAVRAGRAARNALERAVTDANGAPVNANLLTTLVSATSALQAALAGASQ